MSAITPIEEFRKNLYYQNLGMNPDDLEITLLLRSSSKRAFIFLEKGEEKNGDIKFEICYIANGMLQKLPASISKSGKIIDKRDPKNRDPKNRKGESFTGKSVEELATYFEDPKVRSEQFSEPTALSNLAAMIIAASKAPEKRAKSTPAKRLQWADQEQQTPSSQFAYRANQAATIDQEKVLLIDLRGLDTEALTQKLMNIRQEIDSQLKIKPKLDTLRIISSKSSITPDEVETLKDVIQKLFDVDLQDRQYIKTIEYQVGSTTVTMQRNSREANVKPPLMFSHQEEFQKKKAPPPPEKPTADLPPLGGKPHNLNK